MRRRSGTTLLALALSCGAARAESSSGASVWYRSAEGCPDGGNFLGRLTARSARAHLANAGDHIDFVVTLGPATGGYSGRLERQTTGGTIAIRELTGESCGQVADAVALSLALAIEPTSRDHGGKSTTRGTETAQPIAADNDDVDTAKNPYGAPSVAPTARVAPSPTTTNPQHDVAGDRGHSEAPPTSEARAGSWTVLVMGTLGTGLAPSVLPGAGAFVEYATDSPRTFSPAVRLGITASRGSSTTEVGMLAVTIAAARIEGCPLRFSGGTMRFRPCLGFDVGSIAADAAGVSDASPWVAGRLGGRLDWQLDTLFLVEFAADAELPFTRYEIGSETRTVYETAALGFAAGIGVGARFP